MDLPDFRDHEGMNRLRANMRAELNLAYTAERSWHDVSIAELLSGFGAEVDIDEIEIVDGFLEFKGQKVLLYIRDQYQNDDYEPREYKYHVAHCQTLENMWAQDRSKRYVVATRTDGRFHVVTRFSPSGREKAGLMHMNVCKNCLRLMRREHPQSEALWVYENFDLKEFFETFNTEHSRMPVHSDATQPADDYSDDWSDVSLAYRESVGWRCERCGGDFSARRQFLHVHHKDRQKWNNDPSNLEALCSDCHARETRSWQQSIFEREDD